MFSAVHSWHLPVRFVYGFDFEDLPADCVPFIFALQFPDVFTEFGAVLAFVEGRLVISPSCFEVSGG